MTRPSILLGVAALGLIACTPPTPTSHPPAIINGIQAAHVLIAGTPVEGTTLQGDNGTTMFEIRLRERDATSLVLVEMCNIDYSLPMRGEAGQRRTGVQRCFDDGSNGDDVAGDGVCHYLDDNDSIGCGRAGMPTGSYEYRLWCLFVDQTHSEVTLRVSRS